jgi:hypothetical protein
MGSRAISEGGHRLVIAEFLDPDEHGPRNGEHVADVLVWRGMALPGAHSISVMVFRAAGTARMIRRMSSTAAPYSSGRRGSIRSILLITWADSKKALDGRECVIQRLLHILRPSDFLAAVLVGKVVAERHAAVG